MTTILKQLPSLVVAALIFSACGTLKADMEPDWQSPVEVNEFGSVQVMDDGQRIFLGTNKDVYLLDGENGRPIFEFKETFWEFMERSIQVGVEIGSLSQSALLDDFISDSYVILPLPYSNTALLLDYRYNTEYITAIDTHTGEILWANADLEYSLSKYSALISRTANRIGRGLANAIGGDHEGEDEEERLARQINFMHSLIIDLPGEDKFFFKTFDGLLLIDSKSGEILAQIEDFSGSGLVGAERLDNGDYLVLSGGRDIANLSLSSGYHLVRLTSEGETVWITEHNGRRTANLYLSGDVALVDGYPTEAFSIADGEKLWENNVRRFEADDHHMIVLDDVVYFASDLEGRVGQVESSKVWKQDINTGDVLWETESTRTTFNGMLLHNDKLLVYGTGRLFDGNNGGIATFNNTTGEELWKTPEMSSPSIFSSISGYSVTPPKVEGNRVYTADPDELFVLNLDSGELIYKVNHDDHNTGATLGLLLHEDKIIVAGRDAVAAFDKADGSRAYVTEIDRASQVAFHGRSMVFNNGAETAFIVDIATGQKSPVMRHKSGKRIFGTLDNSVFVNSNSTFVISIDDDGIVYRHSF